MSVKEIEYLSELRVLDRDFLEEPLLVWSYGGGTQSNAGLILMAQGLIRKADIIIHADTMIERPETEELVRGWAAHFAEHVLKIPFMIVRSHRGSLYDDYYLKGAIPVMGMRSCTSNFKILPQRRGIRSIVGHRRGHLATCMLGITTDEERRRSTSDVQWCPIEFPMLDEYPLSRDDCIRINEEAGLTVVKSGCVCCPYAGTNFYRELKQVHPNLFQKALELEANAERRVLERSGKPLRMGLVQGKKLRMLDDLKLPDSKCDSGAGCFI